MAPTELLRTKGKNLSMFRTSVEFKVSHALFIKWQNLEIKILLAVICYSDTLHVTLLCKISNKD